MSVLKRKRNISKMEFYHNAIKLRLMITEYVTHPNVEKYMPYVDIIEKEIALLKGWRKSDNKIMKSLEE